MSRPVIVAARRTPVGVAGRALKDVPVTDLGAAVVSAVLDDVRALGIAGAVDDVILGNTRGPGGNIARVSALAAGLGVGVPAMTVDRQCGSGQAAVHTGADAVRAGAGLVLAGGAESASTQPQTWLNGQQYARAPFAPASFGDPDMGPAAQDLADHAGISRERQDAYALRSHELSLVSMASGLEDAELVPVAGLTQDERPRKLRAGVLARMPGVFRDGGSVTVGNSCGISDGAAAVALVPEETRARVGVPGLLLRDWCQTGVDPALPGIGPVPACQRLLARNDLGWDDIGVIEMVEAFAAQVLACTDAWGLDPLGADSARFCPQGGSIARGHPWGASGAVLLVRLFNHMVRSDGPRLGLATTAVGGGQGLALLVEKVG